MMRMLTLSAASLLVVALAGCGGSPSDNGSADAANQYNEVTASPGATQNTLEAMPEGERNAVFIRAIQDAGQTCQHVDSSERAGEHQGLPLWKARCTGGLDYTIVIGNDGVAAILNPAEAGLLEGNAAATGNEVH
jgi:hypothetical protein